MDWLILRHSLSFQEKDLNFAVTVSKNLPEYLELDALHVRQVILNLIDTEVYLPFDNIRLEYVQRYNYPVKSSHVISGDQHLSANRNKDTTS